MFLTSKRKYIFLNATNNSRNCLKFQCSSIFFNIRSIVHLIMQRGKERFKQKISYNQKTVVKCYFKILRFDLVDKRSICAKLQLNQAELDLFSYH